MAKAEVQFNLRVPVDLKERIEESAKNNNRSINAEATSRLYESFLMPDKSLSVSIKALETVFLNNTSSPRKTEITHRLNEALKDINQVASTKQIQPARIAKEIGEDYAEPMERWFSGEQEPSFKQLEIIAEYLNVNPEWLQFGDQAKFIVNHIKIPTPAKAGVAWLLNDNRENQPSHVYFLRKDAKEGTLCVVKRYSDWHCQTYITPYHISEEIGVSGEASLAHLFMTWKHLYKLYVNDSKLSVKSYLIDPINFKELVYGDVHPLKIINNAIDRPWWEDIWDEKQYKIANYWDGWLSLCERIDNVIKLKKL